MVDRICANDMRALYEGVAAVNGLGMVGDDGVWQSLKIKKMDHGPFKNHDPSSMN